MPDLQNGTPVLPPVHLPLSSRETFPFTPPAAEGWDKPPVYILKPMGTLDRARMTRVMIELGAAYCDDDEMRSVLRLGIAAGDPPNKSEILDALDRCEAAAKSGEAAAQEDMALVAGAEAVLRQHYPEYAERVARRVFANEVARIAAARVALVGWENAVDRNRKPLKFARSMDVVPQALLDRLPDGHVEAIGRRALALGSVSEDQEKNSASPSP